MNPHETRPIEIRPGRRSRRKAAQRRRFIQHLLASFILAGTALVLVLVFGQSPEPPMVEATLPDRPEPEVVNDEGLVLDRESVLAPVAAGSVSRAAERPSERRSRPGEGDSTGAPPPAISAAIPPAPPVPPGTPAEPNGSPAGGGTPSADDIDDEPPPPPVTSEPPSAVDEELTRPPIDPIIDPACWDGWTYDEAQRQCVQNDDPEPADRNEDAEEEGETVEEESSRSDDLGVSKGPGSVIRKGNE